MPLTIIFVRHGESTANVGRIFANRPHIPGDLTLAGIAQAQALARSLEDTGLTHIFTSPLPRARQTAEIIAERFGVPVEISDALREYDVGDDEGLPYTGDDAWRWDRYETVRRAWTEGDRLASHPGGESLDDIERRFRAFMQVIITLHDPCDVILAVGHGGLFHAVLPSLFASVPDDIARLSSLGHTDRVVATFSDSAWRCKRWGDVHVHPRE